MNMKPSDNLINIQPKRGENPKAKGKLIKEIAQELGDAMRWYDPKNLERMKTVDYLRTRAYGKFTALTENEREKFKLDYGTIYWLLSTNPEYWREDFMDDARIFIRQILGKFPQSSAQKRSPSGSAGNPTKSGKDPRTLKVIVELSGNTYPKRETLKLEGFVFDSRGRVWNKEAFLSEVESIIRKGVIRKYIMRKQIIPFIRVISKEDYRDVYFWQKEYIDNIWMHPGKTFEDEINRLGYGTYPFLNWRSYVISETKVHIAKDSCRVFREFMEKYRQEHPGIIFPVCEESNQFSAQTSNPQSEKEIVERVEDMLNIVEKEILWGDIRKARADFEYADGLDSALTPKERKKYPNLFRKFLDLENKLLEAEAHQSSAQNSYNPNYRERLKEKPPEFKKVTRISKDKLYVKMWDWSDPISRTWKTYYEVISPLGYRKGYIPIIEILGEYIPSVKDKFILSKEGVFSIEREKPIKGTELKSEMLESGWFKAFFVKSNHNMEQSANPRIKKYKLPAKVEPYIKEWLKLMGQKKYKEAEKINVGKIKPILGKGVLPYGVTKEEVAQPERFLDLVSCIMQVKAKQPKFCPAQHYPRAKGCYSPYAVCRKSVGFSSNPTKLDAQKLILIPKSKLPNGWSKTRYSPKHDIFAETYEYSNEFGTGDPKMFTVNIINYLNIQDTPTVKYREEIKGKIIVEFISVSDNQLNKESKTTNPMDANKIALEYMLWGNTQINRITKKHKYISKNISEFKKGKKRLVDNYEKKILSLMNIHMLDVVKLEPRPSIIYSWTPEKDKNRLLSIEDAKDMEKAQLIYNYSGFNHILERIFYHEGNKLIYLLFDGGCSYGSEWAASYYQIVALKKTEWKKINKYIELNTKSNCILPILEAHWIQKYPNYEERPETRYFIKVDNDCDDDGWMIFWILKRELPIKLREKLKEWLEIFDFDMYEYNKKEHHLLSDKREVIIIRDLFEYTDNKADERRKKIRNIIKGFVETLNDNPTKLDAQKTAEWHRARGKRVRVMKTADDYQAFVDGERKKRKAKVKPKTIIKAPTITESYLERKGFGVTSDVKYVVVIEEPKKPFDISAHKTKKLAKQHLESIKGMYPPLARLTIKRVIHKPKPKIKPEIKQKPPKIVAKIKPIIIPKLLPKKPKPSAKELADIMTAKLKEILG